MYISLYVDVNTFIGGRQPQNKLMRLRTFKKMLPATSPRCSLLLVHCPSADHIVQSFRHVWPPPLNQVASIWCAQCSNPRDKRNFVKFLVPSTLYEAMVAPTTGGTGLQRVLAFKNALPQRQRQLKDALSKALTWLAQDPPPLPRPPPPKVSTSGANHTAPTGRHTPHEHTAIITIR